MANFLGLYPLTLNKAAASNVDTERMNCIDFDGHPCSCARLSNAVVLATSLEYISCIVSVCAANTPLPDYPSRCLIQQNPARASEAPTLTLNPNKKPLALLLSRPFLDSHNMSNHHELINHFHPTGTTSTSGQTTNLHSPIFPRQGKTLLPKNTH